MKKNNSNKTIRNILMSASLMLAFPLAKAQTSEYDLGPWSRTLGELTSNENENLHSFIARVGKNMDSFLDESGNESCGVIFANDETNTYYVHLTTDDVQQGCTMHHRLAPEGFINTGETIHSHPGYNFTIHLRERDRAWNRAHKLGNQRTFTVRRGFSKQDMKSAPGFLVEDGKIYYLRTPNGPSQGRLVSHVHNVVSEYQKIL